ncbi:hypothetical protein, partial [Novosphingopyxis sp. YJ-S2-01]|uniref:hypothetical protein n=1 Tax=Novosphingopyxis sp. YJ-S2-01 TaxID=2794021 RepID=UPI001A1EDFEF
DGYAYAEGFKSNRVARKRIFRRIGVHHDGFCYEGLGGNISPGGAMIGGLWDIFALVKRSLTLMPYRHLVLFDHARAEFAKRVIRG